MISDEQLFKQVMLTRLAVFARRAIEELKPGLPLAWNWHHDLIASRLEDLAAGRLNRLLICVPPRSLKSLICTVCYPAWLAARDAAATTLCMSYSQPLSLDFARQCRQLMDSDFYKEITDTRLSRERRAAEQFETTGGGMRIASSVGGTITGRGGGFVIIDDAMKPETAMSDTGRRSVIEWLRGTVMSRSDDKLTERMLVIMQRLHEEDLAGYLLDQGGWETVILPAIAIEAETHHYRRYGRKITKQRAVGEPLHAVREPLEVLEKLRREMSELTFSAQYQQSPLPAEGNFVRCAWIKRFELAEVGSGGRVIQSWDTASKTGEERDYSACTTWVSRNGLYYLVNAWRGRLDMPDLCRKVIELSDRFSPERVVIEDKDSGTGLIQSLRAQGFQRLIPHMPHGNKLNRFLGVIPRFEGGAIRLPREAPWADDYIAEICGFPNARNDDWVDSTSQAIGYLDTPFPGQGFLEFVQQELEADDDDDDADY